MPHIVKVHSIQKDHKKLLHFEYDDNSQQDYSIIANGNNERTINKDGKTYCLIEEKTQIDERLKTGNFKRCIFLMSVNFDDEKFIKSANFIHAIFIKSANFIHATFMKGASFNSVTFTQDTNFCGAKFTESASFLSATFTRYVIFSNATFIESASFIDVKFIQEAAFIGTIFSVKTGANFSFANFSQALLFSQLKDTGEPRKIKLNLSNAILDRVACINVEFSSDNRETFLTLKNIALKQNDQIKALEFHKQEYETHYKNLDWKQLDKWVLGFEYLSSNFGTSVKRSLFSLLGLIAIFYLAINGFNLDTESLVKFILPTSYDIDTVFSCGVDWWDRWLFLLYKILQLVLIYEIIKSFRKFSRTL